MPPPDFLHQLSDLDQSLSEFPNRLTNHLDGQGYRECIATLQRDQSTWLIEYLDTALSIIPPANPAFPRCLGELRTICGFWRIIPWSCISQDPSPVTTKWPFTSRGSCDVYEGTLGDTKFSVKRLRTYLHDEQWGHKDAFCKEVVLWKHLNHPNIVPFVGATVSPFEFVSAWMVGGELSEYIGTHPCANRLSLISDVADGLNYLHSHGIIHGDLKGPSVLVDEKGRARLTDFGLSEVCAGFRPCGSIKNGHAVRWAAPEILDERMPVSKSSDVYSFSMVAVEAFTGKAPFSDFAPAATAVSVLAGGRPKRPTHPLLTNDFWEIIKCCWSQEPRHRPDVSKVVLCLRNDAGPLCDRIDAHDDQTTDKTALERTQGDGSFIRLCPKRSSWTVLRNFCCSGIVPSAPRFASGKNVQYARPEHEKQANAGASSLSRRERSWFSGHKSFKRPQSDDKRITIADTTHDTWNRLYRHPLSCRMFRTRRNA